MVDKALLSRKLSRLRGYLTEMRQADDISWEKYETDVRAKAFVESICECLRLNNFSFKT